MVVILNGYVILFEEPADGKVLIDDGDSMYRARVEFLKLSNELARLFEALLRKRALRKMRRVEVVPTAKLSRLPA